VLFLAQSSGPGNEQTYVTFQLTESLNGTASGLHLGFHCLGCNRDMQNTTETLGIGSRAPEFRLAAANGSLMISLSQLIAQGPLVLKFMRGTWCHNCRKRMIELEILKSAIRLGGGQLVCIAAKNVMVYGSRRNSLDRTHCRIPSCSTKTARLLKHYGLYHRVGIDAWNVSHPATLVLDRTTRVRYIHKGTSQGDRAPMEDVMKALRKVSAGSAGASAGT
jgi:peroxiredoxin